MKAKKLLDDRQFWMGCAIVMIVWYHLFERFPPSLLSLVGYVSYCGVDIFVFASGIGCFHSLHRTKDDISFYKRRFMRIMPTYFVFIVFWIAFRAITDPLSTTDILGNFFALQGFTEQENIFNWYISFIILMYVMSPLFYGLATSIKGKLSHFGVVALLTVFSVIFWDTEMLVIISCRVPIFYIGMLFGKYCVNNGEMTKKVVVEWMLGILLGIGLLLWAAITLTFPLWEKGFYWYPFIFITPGLCLILSAVRRFLDRWAAGRFLTAALEKAGNYSFEVYLVHILCIDIAKYLVIDKGTVPNTTVTWCVVIIVTVAFSVLLRKLVGLVLGLVRRVAGKTVSTV